METFHKKHNEDMNFSCKKCNRKISAHNKDWHEGMCDDCFDKEFLSKKMMSKIFSDQENLDFFNCAK